MKAASLIAFCVLLSVSHAQIEISPFIIGGMRAPIAPYQVLVNYFNAQGLGFFGGGALISNRHILTAATNVQGFNRFTAHMGASNRTALRQFAVNAPGTPHPNFNINTRANDIAILRLTQALIPTADIHPINLPAIVTPPLVLPLENEEGSFTGFGYDSVNSGATTFLKRGYQRVTSEVICTAFFIVQTENSFCAQDNVERSNGCAGDVGNPFVTQYRRENVLVGILSMHPQCGVHSPTAYTRVTAYRQWIQQQLAIA